METSLTLQETAVQVEGKRFGIRAGAYIIDLVIFYLVGFTIASVEGFTAGIVLYLLGWEFSVEEQSTQLLNFMGGLLLLYLYFAVFEGIYGATPGKLILGMRVIKEGGTPCGLGAALVRGLLRYIDGFFFGLVAYFIMKAPLYQRGGDQAAKTLVVGSRDSVIQERRAWWWFVVASSLYLILDAIVSLFLIARMIR